MTDACIHVCTAFLCWAVTDTVRSARDTLKNVNDAFITLTVSSGSSSCQVH